MRRRRDAILLVAATVPILTALPACQMRDLPAPDVAARIDATELPYADFEAYLRSNSVALEAGLSSRVLSGLFDQYLDEALLSRMAVDRGFAREGDVEGGAVGRMIAASASTEVSSLEIDQYYAEHGSEYLEEDRVLLRQILVEDRERAEMALEAVRSGMSFEEAARRYSQGPSAELGGLQGVLGHDDLPPAFAEVIFALDVGEVSEIVSADYGYHLFQVIEQQSPSESAGTEVRRLIADRLSHEKRTRVIEQLVEEARSSYNVRVYVRNLPFNYEGRYEE